MTIKRFLNNSIMLLIMVIAFLILPYNQVNAKMESNGWKYNVNDFSDVEDGTFDDIIWDDENRRLQLQGKTLYEDFTMYDSIEDMFSQGWRFKNLNEISSTAKIVQHNESKQLYLETIGNFTSNLVASRDFSPTKRGEVEFVITPIDGKTRVDLIHSPSVVLSNGRESNQFMFRFEEGKNGNNAIRFGSNRGGGIKGEEYDIIENAYESGKTYRVKMVWDLNNSNGVSVFLNNKKVVSNFYQSMVTDDFYFYQADLSSGEGSSIIEGTPGKAYYDFVSLEQSFNLDGTYTSKNIPVNVSGKSVLSKNATISWDEQIVEGTSITVQTSVSKDNGETWDGWETVKDGDSIPGLNKLDQVEGNILIKYRVNMTANKNNITPWLKDLKIEMEFDKTEPMLSITPSTTDITHEDIILTVIGSDEISGVKRIKLPDDTWVNGNEASYTVKNNGTFTFVVEDYARNITTKSFTVNNINKTISFENPSIDDFDNVKLGNSTKTITTDISPITIKDWRDDNNQWKINVSATPLKMVGESYTLPKGSMMLKPVSNVKRVDGSGDSPEKGYDSIINIDDGKINVVKSHNSRGEYDIEFSNDALEILIDTTTSKTGTYESTITWDLVSAP